ncbi:hypothetical protein GCM10012320_13850 [Sinomonas cellulolyticus]|jgi:hypothetical protein|uniref:Secreted protein n=1 Tax=Sinomonas cellulolyticus TaxID=2801916 RepID=A0ABS1JZJ1_9MICC|nr:MULTISPECIES: hypothetical protein [Sinomonas]MBL0704819.1 hypothetical protein [Sinomonas cellulolyticus]GHG47252.1 hypothetical protein GCM10012320_13850 [Sinomonas sp. KCTC 49339]
MFRKTIAALGVAAALTLIPTAAHALDCTNLSRPAYTGTQWVYVPEISSNVHLEGNWAYIQAWQAWTFIPPGTVPLTPGRNGNYQNGQGYALLANAICSSKGQVLENRQTTKGIQLMHGCEEEVPQ